MAAKHKYEIYGAFVSDELVFKGIRREIIEHYGLCELTNIKRYAETGQRIGRKYELAVIGYYYDDTDTYEYFDLEEVKKSLVHVKKEAPPEIKETDAEKRKRESIENNLVMIKRYGNTITMPEYLKDAVAYLIENGYVVTARRVETYYTDTVKTRKTKPYYVLERI